MLAGYVVMLDFGPSTRTASGLVAQVVAQKIVTVAAVLGIVFQSYEADRHAAAVAESMT